MEAILRALVENALRHYFKDSQGYIDIQDDPTDVEYQQFINNFTESLMKAIKEMK